MSKHTPGPWRVVNTNSGLFIAGAEPGYFAEVFSGNKTTRLHVPEQHANAHLIAAAPDGLHAAGVAYLALLNLPQTARALPHVQHAMATLRDCIAKATNRTDEDTQAEYETSATLGAS